MTIRERTSRTYVARYVVATGHCNITDGQMEHAFLDLQDWVRNKVHSKAGEQQ